LKKILYLLIFFLWFTGSSLYAINFFEINLLEPLTPFHILKLPLKGIPEDVHFLDANIKLFFENEEVEHTSHYPILKNSREETFSLIHFLWLPESSTDFQKPSKMVVSYNFGLPLPTYSLLLQVGFNCKTNFRLPIAKFHLQIETGNQQQIHKTNSKAVIFIHGIMGGRYEQILQGFSDKDNENKDWKNSVLKQYWQKHYQYDDVDYFEYQFDSLFQSAKFYGEKMCELIETTGLLEAYDKIYLIAYSMGTIVARYAMNTPLINNDDYLGNHINKAFMIGGVLEGTFFANLVDFIITQMHLPPHPEIINTNKSLMMSESFYKTLNMLYHLEAYVFDPDAVSDFLQRFLELYRINPLLANILFISFEDVPFIGGQLIPFAGMSSMRYTSKTFLSQLEQGLNLPGETYIQNIELLTLNKNERFKEKLILINSYLDDAEEILKTIIKTSKYFSLQNVFNNIPTLNHNVDILSIPYVQFIGQRALSLIMKQLGEISSEPLHSMNDGFVTLWSEQMTDHYVGIKKENIYLLKNLDHAQIKDHPQFLELVKHLIQND